MSPGDWGNDMNPRRLSAIRVWLTVTVTLAESAHLAWEHFNGGVASHHFLNRADLPAISNAWGLLLLPTLEKPDPELGERHAFAIFHGAVDRQVGVPRIHR